MDEGRSSCAYGDAARGDLELRRNGRESRCGAEVSRGESEDHQPVSRFVIEGLSGAVGFFLSAWVLRRPGMRLSFLADVKPAGWLLAGDVGREGPLSDDSEAENV